MKKFIEKNVFLIFAVVLISFIFSCTYADSAAGVLRVTRGGTGTDNITEGQFLIGKNIDEMQATSSISMDTAGNVTILKKLTTDTLELSGVTSGNLILSDNWVSNDGGDEGLRVTNDGRVGVGTGSPESIFHVVASSTSEFILQANTGNQYRQTFRILQGSSLGWYWGNESSDEEYMSIALGGAGNIHNNKGRDYVFKSSSVDPILQLENDTGYVGVGTSSPAYELGVAGDIGNDGNIYSTGNFVLENGNGVRAYTSGGSLTYLIRKFTNDKTYLYSNDFVFNNQDEDYTYLTIDYIGAEVAGEFNFNQGKFFLDDSGKVGIGTTTPLTMLDVFTTGTSTTMIDSSSTTKGACQKFKDNDGGGYTYCTYLNGTQTCSQTSCE